MADQPNLVSLAVVLIKLDATKKTATIFEYSRKTEDRAYRSTSRRELPFARARRSNGRILDSDFEQQLQTIASEFSHPRGGVLSYSDLYVAPELEDRSLSRTQKSETKLVSAEDLPEFLNKHKRLVVAGTERSGKSTLAKRVFWQLYERGLQPILLSGRELTSVQEAEVLATIRRSAIRQYGDSTGDHYIQLSRESRTIIIDDIHLAKLSEHNAHRLLSVVGSIASRSIIFSNDVFTISMLSSKDEKADDWIQYQLFVIAEFGRRLRGRLIERWHALGAEREDQPAIDKRVAESEQTLNAVFGQGLVPSYPLFILTSLQLTGIKHNSRTSGSICYTYEHLTEAALSRVHSPYSPDTIPTFASWMAFRMLTTGRGRLEMLATKDVSEQFASTIGLEFDHEEGVSILVNAGLAFREEDSVRFAYKYAQYYYAAKFIQANAARPSFSANIESLISSMVERLDVEEYANVVLFVAYLTKSEELIARVVHRANGLYSDIPACKMEDDVRHISLTLLPSGRQRRPHEEREAMRESEDDAVEAERRRRDEDRDIDELLKLNTALRTLDMLGQILRNSPGSLGAALKDSVLRSCYELGLRIIGYLYTIVAQIPEAELAAGLKTALKSRFRSNGRELTDEELDRMVAAFVRHLHLGLAVTFVRRLSTAVGSKYLSLTYQNLAEASDASVATRIIDAAIRLEHLKPTPVEHLVNLNKDIRRNHFASTVLQQIVRDHIRLYSIAEPTRQRLTQVFDPTETPSQRLAARTHRR